MAVLVCKRAPDFTATAVMGNNDIKDITFSEFTKGKYVVVFFYPLDFTFVCPSELIAFDHRLAEFSARGVEVLGGFHDDDFLVGEGAAEAGEGVGGEDLAAG